MNLRPNQNWMKKTLGTWYFLLLCIHYTTPNARHNENQFCGRGRIGARPIAAAAAIAEQWHGANARFEWTTKNCATPLTAKVIDCSNGVWLAELAVGLRLPPPAPYNAFCSFHTAYNIHKINYRRRIAAHNHFIFNSLALKAMYTLNRAAAQRTTKCAIFYTQFVWVCMSASGRPCLHLQTNAHLYARTPHSTSHTNNYIQFHTPETTYESSETRFFALEKMGQKCRKN